MKKTKNIEAKASKENKKTANAEVANVTIKKVKKSKKDKVTKEVAAQQKSAIIEEVISKREVKYIYPEDVNDSLSRKTWRQKTRNELHRLELKVSRIKDTNCQEYKQALKEFETYRDRVLKPAQVV